jgi:type IV pilus assembly protein PilO
MDLQDPKVQRLVLSVLLSGMVVVFFFGTKLAPFTFSSRNLEIAELRTEHEKLSKELERARLTVGNMEKVEREFEYLHRQWVVAQRLLPDENEMSDLLRRISAAGTQAGLEWVKFTPQPAIAHGFYLENPIDVRLEGGYHQVGSFLGSISNLGRIVNVRNLEIEGVRADQQSDPKIRHTLTASMQVVAYSLDPNASLQLPADVQGEGGQLSADSSGSVRDRLMAARKEATTNAPAGGR